MAILEWYAFNDGTQWAKVYVDYTENTYESYSTITINSIKYHNTYTEYSHNDGYGYSVVQWSMTDDDSNVLSISWNENGTTKTDVMATNLWFPESKESYNDRPLAKTTTSHIPSGTSSITISLTGTLKPQYSAGSLDRQPLTIGSSTGSSSTNKSVGITYVPISYTLSINQGNNSYISVKRTSSPVASASTSGTLSDGGIIYESDQLQITFDVKDGYNISTHTVNGSTFNSGAIHTVSGDVSVVSTATVKSYTLTIQPGTGSDIVIERTESQLQGANKGNLSSGKTIYRGDKLKIVFNAKEGYDLQSGMINDDIIDVNYDSSSIDDYEVKGNVTVSSTASLKIYELTIIQGAGSTITVERTNTRQDGAPTGMLSDDSQIYHFDVLVITVKSTPEYEISEQTINGVPFVNGYSHTVSGAVEVATTTKILGIIYIDNGSTFDKYMVFVDNGTSWDQYIPYIDDGSKWIQYN